MEARDRVGSDESGIGRGALQEVTIEVPQRPDAQHVPHLVHDDLVEDVVLLKEGQIVGIEEHEAVERQEIRAPREARAGRAEHGARTIDGLEQDIDENVVHCSPKGRFRKAVPAGAGRDDAGGVGDVAGQDALPLGTGHGSIAERAQDRQHRHLRECASCPLPYCDGLRRALGGAHRGSGPGRLGLGNGGTLPRVPSLGHTILAFGFEDGRYLAFSAEATKAPDEEYGVVSGMFGAFELMDVVADERDVFGLRANVWGDDVYLYPLRLSW